MMKNIHILGLNYDLCPRRPSMNFLITMTPPAAVSNPRPPMGVWVGASGKLDWAKIIVEKNYR